MSIHFGYNDVLRGSSKHAPSKFTEAQGTEPTPGERYALIRMAEPSGGEVVPPICVGGARGCGGGRRQGGSYNPGRDSPLGAVCVVLLDCCHGRLAYSVVPSRVWKQTLRLDEET